MKASASGREAERQALPELPEPGETATGDRGRGVRADGRDAERHIDMRDVERRRLGIEEALHVPLALVMRAGEALGPARLLRSARGEGACLVRAGRSSA